MDFNLQMLGQYPAGHPLLFHYLDLVEKQLSDQADQVVQRHWTSTADRVEALTSLRDYHDFNRLSSKVREHLFALDSSVDSAGLASAASDLLTCDTVVESWYVLPSDHDLLSAITTVLMSGSDLDLPDDMDALYDFAGEVLASVAGSADCAAQARHLMVGMVIYARLHWPNVAEFVSMPSPSPSVVVTLLRDFRHFLSCRPQQKCSLRI